MGELDYESKERRASFRKWYREERKSRGITLLQLAMCHVFGHNLYQYAPNGFTCSRCLKSGSNGGYFSWR